MDPLALPYCDPLSADPEPLLRPTSPPAGMSSLLLHPLLVDDLEPLTGGSWVNSWIDGDSSDSMAAMVSSYLVPDAASATADTASSTTDTTSDTGPSTADLSAASVGLDVDPAPTDAFTPCKNGCGRSKAVRSGRFCSQACGRTWAAGMKKYWRDNGGEGALPLQCGYCGRAYATNSNLMKHLRTACPILHRHLSPRETAEIIHGNFQEASTDTASGTASSTTDTTSGTTSDTAPSTADLSAVSVGLDADPAPTDAFTPCENGCGRSKAVRSGRFCSKACGRTWAAGMKKYWRDNGGVGALPLQCGYCGRTYATSSNLMKHLRVVCPVLHHNLSSRETAGIIHGNLQKAATDSTQCMLCERSFSTGSNLRKHLRVACKVLRRPILAGP